MPDRQSILHHGLGIVPDLDAHTYNMMEKYRVGDYMFGLPISTDGTSVLIALKLYLRPFIVARAMTIDRLAIEVTTAVANYTTGTAAFTNGSDQVVGTLTVFAASHVGARIKNDTDGEYHYIKSVEDATHLTLTATYSSTGGAAAAYTINHIARLGVYADNGSISPGALVKDYGVVSLSSVAIVAASADQQLTKGINWLAAVIVGEAIVRIHLFSWSPLNGTVSYLMRYYSACGHYEKGNVGTTPLADPCVSGLTACYSSAVGIVARLKSLD